MTQNDTILRKAIEASQTKTAECVLAGAPPRQVVDAIIGKLLPALPFTLSNADIQAWHSKLLAYAQSMETSSKHSSGSPVAASVNASSPASHPVTSPTRYLPVVLGIDTETQEVISITPEELESGSHILGSNGTGKTRLIIGMSLQDIQQGQSVLFVDVDGENIDLLLPYIPKERMGDVILLDVIELAKMGRYIGLNPLSALKQSTEVDATIDRYMHVFKMLWNIGKETPRLESTLHAALHTLALNNLTLMELPQLLRDKEMRRRCIEAIPQTFATEGLRLFWRSQFDALYTKNQLEYSDSTLNKVLQFLMIEKVLFAVCQDTTTIDFRSLMDSKKIVLLKLNPQEMGETAARFLGAFLMAELKNALFSRFDVASFERPAFSFYADEWQLYVTADFKEILTRGRKYGIQTVVANQALSQLDEVDKQVGLHNVLRGITEQVNTLITFRVNGDDAQARAIYYAPDTQPEYEEREKTIISPEPIADLLGNHPHDNQTVTLAFHPWRELVKETKQSIKEGSRPGTSTSTINRRGVTKTSSRPGYSWSNRKLIKTAHEKLDEHTSYFYAVMTEKRRLPFPPDVFVWLISTSELDCCDASVLLRLQLLLALVEDSEYCCNRFCSGSCGKTHLTYKEVEDNRNERPEQQRVIGMSAINQYWKWDAWYALPIRDYTSLLARYLSIKGVSEPTETQLAAFNRLWEVEEKDLTKAFADFEQVVRKSLLEGFVATIAACCADVKVERDSFEPYNATQPSLCTIPSDRLQPPFMSRNCATGKNDIDFQAITATNQLRDFEKHLEQYNLTFLWPIIDPSSLIWEKIGGESSERYWQLQKGQVPNILHMPLVKTELSRLIDTIVTEQKDTFENLVRLWRDVLQTLIDYPVMVRSGVREKVEVRRRQVQDVENDKAKKLVELPNREAFVAIKSRGDKKRPQIVTQSLGQVTLDGKILQNEEITKLLSQRKKQALQNTIPYTTEKTALEKQVHLRRQLFGIESAPANTPNVKPAAPASPSPAASTVSPAPAPISRTPHPLVSACDAANPDYLTILYFLSNATLNQCVKIAGLVGQTKDEQTKINKREQYKINKLIGDKFVETVEPEQTKFLITSGRAPLVYRLTQAGYEKLQAEKALTPINAAGFSPHAYKVVEVVISLVQGIKETSHTLVDFCSEKMFRSQKPIKLKDREELEPDAWLCVKENGKLHSLFIEVDRRTMGSGELKNKIGRYLQAIEQKAHKGFTADMVTIVFLNPQGKASDTDRLVRVIQEATSQKDAHYFLVGSVTIEDIAPLDLLTGAIYRKPFDTASHSLL